MEQSASKIILLILDQSNRYYKNAHSITNSIENGFINNKIEFDKKNISHLKKQHIVNQIGSTIYIIQQ